MKTRLFSIFLMLILISIVYSPFGFTQDSPQWHLPEDTKVRLGKGEIYEMQYSPDSTHLAVASGIGIWIYDAHSGKELRLITGHTSFVLSISYSPDGMTLASASADNTIRLWDTNTGQHKKTLRGHTDWVSSVSFSPDSTTLATGSRDETVGLWNVATGTRIATLTRHRDWVRSVAFSPDGQTLASGDRDGSIRLWEADTGTYKRSFSLLGFTATPIHSIAFSPDGTILASGNSSTLILWDVRFSGQRTINQVGDVRSVAFSPDGQTFANANHDEIQLWDTTTNFAGVVIGLGTDIVHRQRLTGHMGAAYSVAFSSDGQTLANGGYWGIRLWNALSGEHKPTDLQYWTNVRSIVFSPDGNTIATGNGWSINLWNALTGKKKWGEGHPNLVLSVAFSPDGTTVASGTYRYIRLWDAETGEEKWEGEHTHWVLSVVFSPDGTIVASGSSDDTLRLWNANTGEHIRTLIGHTGNINSVAFSPDGTIVASGSSEGTILLWDVSGIINIFSIVSNTSILEDQTVEDEVDPIDVLIYIGSAWGMKPLDAKVEAETTKNLLEPEGIQVGITADVEYVREWMIQTTNDGSVNVLILYGVIPDTIYPHRNTQPNGSVAERWIETQDGNTIMNQADYIGWSSQNDPYTIDTPPEEWPPKQPVDPGKNKGITLRNLMDISNITINFRQDNIPMYVTDIGRSLTPSLVDFRSDRPFPLTQLQGEWFAEKIFASDTGDSNATLADPVIVRDGNRGRLAIVHQTNWKDNSKGEVAAEIIGNYLLAEPVKLKEDVNNDSIVNILDLVLVANNFGKSGENVADVNGDSVVNILDLVVVAGAFGKMPSAPALRAQAFSMFTAADVKLWLSQAQQLTLTDATSQRGILFLEQLLATLIPKETALLPNYPNPFNPETWIPYQLAKPAEVTVSIYAINGQVVRILPLGHQASGIYYNRSRAAYWDGKNELGEPVASGSISIRLLQTISLPRGRC